MNVSDLHTVEEITLREVWPHEEDDFTPWMVENIDPLATAIGIEVEDVDREMSVGNYTADIVGTELTTEDSVVIENQFGPTDHNHLGKLLTYAAGIDAGFVVWVAESFRDEHRSVLDWLNDRDAKGARFFGVRPRVISVGGDGTAEDNTIGFEFTVVVEPNDWERDLREPLTDREQAYREFFTQMVDMYAEEHPRWNQPTPQTRSYLTFGAGVGGLEFAWVFHGETEFAVELYIDTGETERNEAIFDTLQNHQTTIEAKVSGDVVWERLSDRRACRIKVPRPDSGPVEELATQEQYNLIKWGTEQMDSFRNVVEPQFQKL